MSTSLHQLAVPVFIRGSEVLSGILKKGETFTTERGISPESVLDTRLYPNMRPLTYQVQRVSHTAMDSVARLAGMDEPQVNDDEASFAALYQRLEATIAYLQDVDPATLNGREDMEVVHPGQTNSKILFDGRSYIQSFIMPNFYFHITVAYSILRTIGVPLGKLDFLGPLTIRK
jgi:hypothetical protein